MAHETLGQRLRQARLEAGLSGAQLARLIGRSQPYVSDLERGQRTPSLATMQALAEALGKPFSFFFDTAATETASSQEAVSAEPGGCFLVAAGYVANPSHARELVQRMAAEGVQAFMFKARWELGHEQLAHLVEGLLENSLDRLRRQPRSHIRYEDFEDLPRRERHERPDIRDAID